MYNECSECSSINTDECNVCEEVHVDYEESQEAFLQRISKEYREPLTEEDSKRLNSIKAEFHA